VRRHWGLALLVLANLALVGVGALRGGDEVTGAKRRLHVGLVLDVGGLGDKSFNDAAHRGLMRAAD